MHDPAPRHPISPGRYTVEEYMGLIDDGVLGPDDRVELLVLAGDAKASATLSPVLRLGQRGRVRLFKSKAELGAAFKRDELALVGILSSDLSQEVSRMISVSELEEPGRAHRLTEVG